MLVHNKGYNRGSYIRGGSYSGFYCIYIYPGPLRLVRRGRDTFPYPKRRFYLAYLNMHSSNYKRGKILRLCWLAFVENI